MDRRSDYMKVLDYIVNRASPEEIRGIEMALDRRRSEAPAGVADLDFEKMASQMASKLGHTLDFDVKGMSRRLVAEMILQQVPDITDEALAGMLDRFVPSAGRGGGQAGDAAGSGLDLPRDVRLSMIDQFVRYSIGRMPAEELQSLKKASPDWVNRYWSAFDGTTRELIGRLLKAEIDSEDFWNVIERM